MYETGIRFSQEIITGWIGNRLEELHKDNYAYAKYLRQKSGLNQKDSLDIILVAHTVRTEEKHIHDALNYKISRAPSIPTFFRGYNGKPFFHFPAGINFYLFSAKEFSEGIKSKKFNIWSGLCYDGLRGLLLREMEKSPLFPDVTILNIDTNPYFNYENDVKKVYGGGLS